MTVASGVSQLPTTRPKESASGDVTTIRIEHPTGTIDVRLETEGGRAELEVQRASVVLTARKVMEGQVFVP